MNFFRGFRGVLSFLCLAIGEDVKRQTKKGWQELATEWAFQGVVTDWSPRFQEKFTCDEVGLRCSPWEATDNKILQTWCCHWEMNHIYDQLEYLAAHHGIDYELGDGCALGSTKLSNFMPWDIDGDVYVSTKAIYDFFQPGQKGTRALQEEGILGL